MIGLEEVEKEQKKEQKSRAKDKKVSKKETRNSKQETKIKEQDVKSEVKEETKRKKVAKARVRGLKYRKAKDQILKDKSYSLPEAILLLKQIKYAKFDESVELHMNTTDSGLRGEITLPHPTGKSTRAVIVDDKLIDSIAAGKIEFDILVSHPSYMPKLAKFAKILGPRGLMPNPKTGTISVKPEEVVKKFQGGQIRWKGEAKSPLIHQMIGKISADDKALIENAQAFIQAVGTGKIKQAFIKTTMSPSLKITPEV